MHKDLAAIHERMKKHFQSHAHLWKKIAIVTLLLTQATSFFFNGNGFSWSYPLKEVAKDSACRKTKWSELSDDCKIALPIINGANYEAYKNNPTYTSIYTTLWGAPYDNGWAYGQWSHEWVDIVSSEGTPVYAVEDGLVIRAKAQAGYGNVVMIKHTLNNGKVVYSVYGHLYSITVPENAKVKEGDMIGTVGNEGYSFGNHLLWDINTTPTNTYAFWECPEYNNGYTFNVIANIVNQGLCRDYLLQRTADPIAWIESQGGTIALGSSKPSTIAATTKTDKRKYVMVPLAPAATPVQTSTAVTASLTNKVIGTKTIPVTKQKSLSTVIVSTKDVSKNEVAFASVDSKTTSAWHGTTMEINNTSKLWEDFLSKYSITMTPSFGNSMTQWQTSSLVISITDKNGKPYVGMLPKELTIIPSESLFTISPQVVRLTDSQGKAVVLLSADRTGTSDLIVSYNMKSVAKITVTVR